MTSHRIQSWRETLRVSKLMLIEGVYSAVLSQILGPETPLSLPSNVYPILRLSIPTILSLNTHT